MQHSILDENCKVSSFFELTNDYFNLHNSMEFQTVEVDKLKNNSSLFSSENDDYKKDYDNDDDVDYTVDDESSNDPDYITINEKIKFKNEQDKYIKKSKQTIVEKKSCTIEIKINMI